ncbi:restriction endonuclease subunit S [Lactiplantibacillus plantarum]|uniref:restriction endonuclease subunit S n=1 Tax=Lactiplantibacillus plantarum TaxID=1590 RepID=UPI002651B868|nr:restriction endonuclease subunit S [Lactiplantibacillus plantarum]MDN7047777.1 hypothetical protein [Lactiplantibacillus plantarum]MDN7066173.1 hypothetical protein [Lactiplantibacillus plantarum]MDN7072294.1 hypothetical protein [Lactiplantibacillus plantarum]
MESRTEKLGDIADITTGKTPSKRIENAYGNVIKFLTPRDFSGRFSVTTERMLSDQGYQAVYNQIVSGPSVSVTCIGSDMGKVIYNRESVVTNQQVNTLSNFKSNVDPLFLYYLLSTKKQELLSYGAGNGSTMPIITKSMFSKLEIKLPSVKVQRKLVACLSLLDDKIELNQQINKNLLKLINNIYLREYFANPQVALADHVALSDLIQTKTKTFNPKKTSETLVNHFSMPAFDEDQYPIIDKVTSIKSNKNIVEPFSVLVSKMNPQVKRVWLPNISDKILNVASTEFLTFTADSAEMQAFIFAIVNNKSYKQFLMSNTTGSTNSRQRVLPRVAYSFEIAFNRIKAERLGELLVPFLEKIKLTKSEIQRLKKLRALLLPKLLSGSINLSSMEEAMKNA